MVSVSRNGRHDVCGNSHHLALRLLSENSSQSLQGSTAVPEQEVKHLEDVPRSSLNDLM